MSLQCINAPFLTQKWWISGGVALLQLINGVEVYVRHKKRFKSPQAGQTGQVRLIGGAFRGRKLSVLTAEGLRPTSDRVRETVFNWLQFDIPGARCLDVFAGSGALGFEALSRGASHVDFIELNPLNRQPLAQNIKLLQVEERASLYAGDALSVLPTLSAQPYDIIFLDPPFGQGLMAPAIQKLFERGLISPQSGVYLEQERTAAWPELPKGWGCHREKTTSQVKYGLFRFEGA